MSERKERNVIYIFYERQDDNRTIRLMSSVSVSSFLNNAPAMVRLTQSGHDDVDGDNAQKQRNNPKRSKTVREICFSFSYFGCLLALVIVAFGRAHSTPILLLFFVGEPLYIHY